MLGIKHRFPLGQNLATRYRTFIPLILFLGFLLRFSLVFSSTNFDFDSYKITANLILDGVPPWQSQRYNYGISWSVILSCLYTFSSGNDFVFRLLIIAFLSMADFVIYLILKEWFGYKTALIFFLNPISIIITGHYNQFDNLSIAVGFLAINSLIKFRKSSEMKFLVFCISLLTLSLTIKHNLVLFLLWLIFSNFTFRIKTVLIVVPYLLFLLHFVPFMLLSKFDRDSILSAVFKYWSANNAPFWKFWFWDKEFAESLGDHTAWHHGRLWMVLMFVSVSYVGFLCRKLDLRYLLPIYSLVLVLFSSALTSQFLAIAAIGACVFFNWGFALFFIFETVCLIADPAGFNSGFFNGILVTRGWNSWNTAPSLMLIGITFYLLDRRSIVREFLSNVGYKAHDSK